VINLTKKNGSNETLNEKKKRNKMVRLDGSSQPQLAFNIRKTIIATTCSIIIAFLSVLCTANLASGTT
jgi:hypothetical protein